MALILTSLATFLTSISINGYVKYRGSLNQIQTYRESFVASNYFFYDDTPALVGYDTISYSNYDGVVYMPNTHLNFTNVINNSPTTYDNCIEFGFEFNITYQYEDVGMVTSNLCTFSVYKTENNRIVDFVVKSNIGYTNIYLSQGLFYGGGDADNGFKWMGGLAGMPSYDIFDDAQYFNTGSCGLYRMSFQLVPSDVYQSIYDAYQTDNYQYGYDNGYKDGTDYGKDIGKEEGYQDGYDVGKTDGIASGRLTGYNEGYVAGAQSTGNPSFMGLFTSIADTPILMIRQLFGFEIFGTSALAVVFSLLTAFIIIKILKKVLK